MKGLSSFQLKILALIAMTIDHAGALLYNDTDHLWMRLVGRLAFPIFAFLIAESFRHTENVQKYALRLLLFAVLSMYPYYLAFGWTQNVLFSFLCGLLALWGMEEKAKNSKQKVLFLLLACLLSIMLLCDWHLIGVLMVVGFYYARRSPWKIALVLLFCTALHIGCFAVYALYRDNMEFLMLNRVQLGTLLAFPFLCLYNGKRGRFPMRYFFYFYYPAHLLVLYVVSLYGIDGGLFS